MAGLALIAALALGVSTASAAEGPPVISPVAVEEIGYTTAEVSGTVGSDTEPGWSEYSAVYCYQYALASDPAGEEKWMAGGQGCNTGTEAPIDTVTDELVKLTPGTTYQVRIYAFNGYNENGQGYSERVSPQPYTTFTTKSVNKSSAALTISDITLDTARISGVIKTNAPPGPLDAAQKAAYRTEWQLICRPTCEFGTPLSTGVLEGDETSQAFTWNTIRLEANTYYEVELFTTNGDESQKTITATSFTTPTILPKVTTVPGGSSGSGSFSIGAIVTPYNTKISDCHFEYGPTTEYVYRAPCSPNPVGRNEVQRFTIPAPNGEFRLTFRGQTTGDITVGADPEVVEKELQALSVIGPEGVTKVVRQYGFFAVDYEIFFDGPLSGTNLNPLKVVNGGIPIFVEGSGNSGCCTGDDLGSAGSVVDGGNNAPVIVESDLTGLTPGTTYHYRVVATNSVGTVTSNDVQFLAPLDPGDNPCPNEEVRIENHSTRLPECRAYELVTTAFTSGYGAEMDKMSINQGTVSYKSRAGNINNSGAGSVFSNTYIAVRHENGWKTIADLNGPRGSLFAPPTEFTTAYGARQYSSDLLRSIWFINTPQDPFDLWVGYPFLRGSDGNFTKISNPPQNEGSAGIFQPQYLGASEDLTHMFWIGSDYGADTWAPGVGPGLYEYEGIGHKAGEVPRRIDLRNDGTTISDCVVAFQGETTVAYFNTYSPDGKTVVFTEKDCGGHKEQIWARVDASKSYFASKSQCTRTSGDPGGACDEEKSPSFERMSKDASSVVFSTTQQLLNSDTDQTKDIYEYVLPTASDPNPSPNLFQVSGAAPNAKALNSRAVSDDGRRVYFIAQGVLASNHDAYDNPPFPGDFNLYVWDRTADPKGVTKFIARLEDPPQNYDVSGFNPRISADGRYMVFTAYHPLVPTDTDNSLDIYRYDAVKGEMLRLSVDNGGVGGNTDFSNADFGYGGRVLSDDGQQVVFITSEALSPDDGNGAPDAYLWQEGHTTLVSTGSVGGGADTVVIDGSGDNIYITSTQQLTADDVDTVTDVYDVRRGGGFSFDEAPPCAGEGCQPASAPAPDNGAPATDGAGSKGNYRPATISIKPMSSSQRAALAAGGEAELPLKVSGPGKISLDGSARIGRRSSRVLTAASRAVQAGVVHVPISLSQSALSELRNRGVLTLQLAAVLADSDPANATLKLKPTEARRKRSKRGNG